MGLRTLLIDNYDSYTFNLFQMIAKVNQQNPVVIRNDQIEWQVLQEFIHSFDNIVISPGPGSVTNNKDFGICRDVILNVKDIPILGVCLGHQGIAYCYGGKILPAKEVMHGRLSKVSHFEDGNDDEKLFLHIPSPFNVVRYHSLAVEEATLPDCLKITGISEDGTIMSLKHKVFPQYGVQFHPESIKTSFGCEILENFKSITIKQSKLRKISEISGIQFIEGSYFSNDNFKEKLWNQMELNSILPHGHCIKQTHLYKQSSRKLNVYCDSDKVFEGLFSTKTDSFWLDSARVEKGLSQFSFMGCFGGPKSMIVSYSQPSKVVTVKNSNEKIEKIQLSQESFFEWISTKMEEMHITNQDLPFDFNCGFVGYFGYEMGMESDGPQYVHCIENYLKEQQKDNFESPDAHFMFADRVVAFDHLNKAIYLVCFYDDTCEKETEEWMKKTESRIEEISESQPKRKSPENAKEHSAQEEVALSLDLARPRDQYVSDIQQALDFITKGESYEVCLTTQIKINAVVDGYKLYSKLRVNNPAPYSSFLNFSALEGSTQKFAIVSSSPERYLKVDKYRVAESKPIKGTCPRGKTKEEDETLKKFLETSTKNFSENLMIVDLLRNDLGKVCEIGSVKVTRLMAVESYQTVHQLVSTIQGKLREGLFATDAVRHCFPPGSMTGAPKHRTMSIIDQLEKKKRGVYSGVLGFLGLCGSADFSVVIRTAVVHDKGVSIGAGGAIIHLSDPEEEFQELMLKARTVLPSISQVSKKMRT